MNYTNYDNGYWSVYCINCVARGPRFLQDPEGARAAWNNRAVAADGSDDWTTYTSVPLVPLVMDTAAADLREQLAAYAHEAWVAYMDYFLNKCSLDGDPLAGHEDDLIIPAGYVAALRVLIATPYADLPDEQKDYDRAEADKMLAVRDTRAAAADVTRLVEELLSALQIYLDTQWKQFGNDPAYHADMVVNDYRTRLAELLGDEVK